MTKKYAEHGMSDIRCPLYVWEQSEGGSSPGSGAGFHGSDGESEIIVL
jgi:hypothetical protein